jgi:ubiquinol-cytochrome c reductase cytochrome b subunit
MISGGLALPSPAAQRHAHRSSFLLHMRPWAQPRSSANTLHTFHLGFLAFFLFIVEALTGLLMMVYYVPTPLDVYPSILRLTSQVPFGDFLRDLHRLGGEAMLVVVFFHMVRTYLSDSFRGKRSFTWLLGVWLLLIALGLVFTGYLLPWDQRSYWAVTIGTGMMDTVPLIGKQLSAVLRGGPVIAGSGL